MTKKGTKEIIFIQTGVDIVTDTTVPVQASPDFRIHMYKLQLG